MPLLQFRPVNDGIKRGTRRRRKPPTTNLPQPRQVYPQENPVLPYILLWTPNNVFNDKHLRAWHCLAREFRGDIHLIRTILRFRSTFLRLEGTAKHLFEPSNECLVSERATRADVPAQPYLHPEFAAPRAP